MPIKKNETVLIPLKSIEHVQRFMITTLDENGLSVGDIEEILREEEIQCVVTEIK